MQFCIYDIDRACAADDIRNRCDGYSFVNCFHRFMLSTAFDRRQKTWNGLLPDGTKALSEPMLTTCCATLLMTYFTGMTHNCGDHSEILIKVLSIGDPIFILKKGGTISKRILPSFLGIRWQIGAILMDVLPSDIFSRFTPIKLYDMTGITSIAKQYNRLPGPRLSIKTVLSTYGDFHVKDKTAVRTSYL